MATSPLDPSNTDSRSDRILNRGHGTRALGPSDSSDSGSDIAGAGDDTELDSDTDRAGTGERAAAEGSVPDGADIAPDHIERVEGDEDENEEGDEGKE